jgi:hypothetical protein
LPRTVEGKGSALQPCRFWSKQALAERIAAYVQAAELGLARVK